MKVRLKQLLCLCLAALMISSAAITAYASNDGKHRAVNYGKGTSVSTAESVAFENVTGSVDLSKVVIDNLSDSVLKADEFSSATTKAEDRTVIVTLDSPTLMDYADGAAVDAFIRTADGKNAVSKIKRAQDKVLNELKANGIKYTLVDRYDTVTNAIALKVSTAKLAAIKGISSVATAVVSETYNAPETITTFASGAVTNPSNVYKTGIYDTSAYDDEYGYGMTVAVLDTGLDYTHDAFSDKFAPTETRFGLTATEVDEVLTTLSSYKKSEAKGDTLATEDVYLSRKVPFAYDYADDDADVYPAYSQHGVHVAGIVAGESDTYYDKDGVLAKDDQGNNDKFRGAAPKAQLVICKVFTDDLESKDIGGAVSEDIIAALDDCVKLGVDVINMSLGTSCGFSSLWIEGDDEGQQLYTIYQRIKQAGISLMCAASNDFSSGYGGAYGTNLKSNPDSATIGSPSTFDGAMSVASINGQEAPYMMVGEDAIFFEEASNANSVPYDFVNDILAAGEQKKTYKYVIVPGVGEAVDYTNSVSAELLDKSAGKTIAVVKRGKTNFQEKVEMAMQYADAVIIYNNVAGSIRMNLGDIVNPIPAVSVSIDAGEILRKNANGKGVGYIEVSRDYTAGPFMNDYSSWGPTPDLKLKPDVTAHGGEILSAVSGGYQEMSGTSMATPNLAGLTALVRSYVIEKFALNADIDAKKINTITNQLLMSTATTVYNEVNLPYSPRKQGSGLATVANIFTSEALLYTNEAEGGAEDNRPKVELGQDDEKNGVYTVRFYLNNFSAARDLQFRAKSLFFTETVAIGGLAVAEKAYMLNGSPAWKVNGSSINEGDLITVAKGASASIEVTLTLSDDDKAYIDGNFENGMFVEGFVKLLSASSGQCDLTLPFMGFYGDYKAAPMLDYSCYEVAEFEKDTSLDDDEKPKASVWATQAYAMYYNEKYVVPMGQFVYLQNDDLDVKDKLFVNEDYAALSCYNEYYGEGSSQNYVTATGIKALYAGLLRNAELVTYSITDAETGELVTERRKYRVGKAYSGGGRGVPASVLMEERPEELGLVANGKYKIDFAFYSTVDEEDEPVTDENSFSMTFYLDYEAPILTDTRVRYYEYEESNRIKQRVYLDFDIYDNHYPQALLLCYSDTNAAGEIELMLATEYVTPILSPNKNGTTTVSIEVTEFYEKYKDRLYLQIDDYALNHNIYKISFASSKISRLPDEFSIVTGGEEGEIEIGVNEALRLELEYEGDANISSFIYNTSARSIVAVKDGEIFGVREGKAKITVGNGKGETRELIVNVVDKGIKLNLPSIKFGVMENAGRSLVPAGGAVDVAAGKTFALDIVTDPWYYDKDDLTLVWSTTDASIATVTQDGVVSTKEKRGTAVIKAVVISDGRETLYSATVILNVNEPFTIENMTLSDYNGLGGHVVLPDDENIMYIGEEAFKDNTEITSIVIPKTVQYINERAFVGCTNLKEVYFVSTERQEIADSDLALIYRNAFQGCTSLEKIDLSNVKVVTLDKYVFSDCVNLNEIVDMHKIVKMDDLTFSGCTGLKSVDVSGVHTAGRYVFSGCTSIEKAVIGKDTVLGEGMFYGCTALKYSNDSSAAEKDKGVVINTPVVPAYAFANCGNIRKITFADNLDDPIVIGASAFSGCVSLESISFGSGNAVKSVGSRAFEKCAALSSVVYPGFPVLGSEVYAESGVAGVTETVYNGTVLVKAPKSLNASFAIAAGTTEIAPYAFEGAEFADGYVLTLPASVVKIGEGAFRNSNLTEINATTPLTEIPAYCFYGTPLTKLPAISNPIIGAYAFANTDLSQSGTPGVALMINARKVGSSAFAGTKLTEVHLVSGEIGDRVFEGADLEAVTIESVEVGQYTFFGCDKLSEARFFGATGSYTFCTEMYGRAYESALEKVEIHGDEIGAYAFYGCDKLYNVPTFDAKRIGYAAFADCSALKNLSLTAVTDIGPYAFINVPLNPAEGKLTLSAAKRIGAYAFAQEKKNNSTVIAIETPVVQSIGAYAFYASKLTEVNLPATVKAVGEGAFAASKALTSYTVASGSSYFAEDGVLYRAITNYETGKTDKYELTAYPTAKLAPLSEDGKSRIYEIKVGTVTVAAYAFGEITDDVITRVKFPYSIRTIGDAAFYDSGIGEYWFECINAPALLTVYRDNGTDGFYSLVNANFEKYIGEYVTDQNLIISTATRSPLRLYHATNGINYDNYIYSNFFGTAETIGILMDDETRTVKENIEGFEYTIEQINEMNSWEVNEANTAIVQAFADKVKETHRLLNNITDPVQLEFLGSENVTKLTEVEKALKSVKSRFSIAVLVSGLRVAPDSQHRSAYTVGEKFDMTGLKLIVEYDDYSSEYADMSKITLSAESDHELNEFDLDVKVEGYGSFVRIEITVTPPTDEDGKGFNAAWIYVPVICVVVIGGGLAAFFIIRKRKKGAAKPDEDQTDGTEAEAENSTEAEATEEETEERPKEKVQENTEKPVVENETNEGEDE